MAAFYITEGDFLVSHGCAADGTEAGYANAGQQVFLGTPPGFTREPTPYSGARWHVEQQCWVDTRTEAERKAQAVIDVQVARRAAYPPLEDLGDALFWQGQGDPSKLDAYLAAVAAVKEKFPKIDVQA